MRTREFDKLMGLREFDGRSEFDLIFAVTFRERTSSQEALSLPKSDLTGLGAQLVVAAMFGRPTLIDVTCAAFVSLCCFCLRVSTSMCLFAGWLNACELPPQSVSWATVK